MNRQAIAAALLFAFGISALVLLVLSWL